MFTLIRLVSYTFIVSIKPYGKTKKKIELSDGTKFLLYSGEVGKWHLNQDKELCDDEVLMIMETLYRRAKERALYLLDAAYRTEHEIYTKLSKSFYPESVIADVISYLKKYDMIDDLRYAHLYFEYKSDKKSKRQLFDELSAKGISRELIKKVWEEGEYSDTVSLEHIIEKVVARYDLSDKKDVQKLYRYLLGRGYFYSDIQNALPNHIAV